jgi:hypothetical protein
MESALEELNANGSDRIRLMIEFKNTMTMHFILFWS